MNALILPFEARYEEYLHDESKMSGQAQSISFPRSKEDVASIIRQMNRTATPVTVQGGKTGICGGAVPMGGHVLNLSCMNKALGMRKTDKGYEVTVQAGMPLLDLDKQLETKSFDTSGWDAESKEALAAFRAGHGYFWPVEPTETSATVGGVLATNAQGITALLYGDTKNYVQGISLIDGNATELSIRRGEYRSEKEKCALPNGKTLEADALSSNTNLLDLFLGSEGLYGVIAEATLSLIKRPQVLWGIAFFFAEQDNLFRFAQKVITAEFGKQVIAAIEYIDRVSLDHIAQLKKVATKLKVLPEVEDAAAGMIYVELHGETENEVELIAESLMELLNECGGNEESTWALSGKEEIEKLRVFRHAAPESINIAVEEAHQRDPRITKLSTDITLQNKSFADVVGLYQREAGENGLKIAVFGHVAGNHVHANILAKDYDQYERGKALLADWSNKAAQEGGIVFSEHGVGKLKKELFENTADPKLLTKMRSIKKVMDEKGILNPATRFDAEKEVPC